MPGEADWRGRKLHFVGVGGSGMSGLARVCVQLGATVTGSDRASDPGIRGAAVAVGHAPERVPPDAELVYSSAVRPDNVERARGRELGLRELRRGELLAELSRLRRCVAVAGTHGKTTTAWMIVHALRAVGPPPSYVIGAALRDGSPSSAWHPGEWLVLETDESDRTFLAVEPEIGVVTNVSLEHTREYRSLAELEEAFAAFAAQSGRAVTGAQAVDVRLGPGGTRFRWRERTVRLPVPGEHNAHNAAAALEACRLAGVDGVDALATYPGARRRLELLGQTPAGARVYDDYAIHENEITASLAALRTLYPGRVVAVFEPLLYSRTREMAAAWGRALSAADAVVVLDVFAGSEAGDEPVSSQLVLDAVDGPPVVAREQLEAMLRTGDACVFMGVGPAPQRIARALAGLG